MNTCGSIFKKVEGQLRPLTTVIRAFADESSFLQPSTFLSSKILLKDNIHVQK